MKKIMLQVCYALCILLIACSNSDSAEPLEEPTSTQNPKQENNEIEPLSAVDTHG